MGRLILAYVAIGLTFAGLDILWLSHMGPAFYAPRLAGLALAEPRMVPAVAFYAVYVAGLVWFGVRPAQRWPSASLNGALLGIFAYGTYDLTNQATLKVWPAEITAVDMGWGVFASAVATTVGYLLTRARKP